MRLIDPELRDVLARAEEIERAARRGDAWNAELAPVIGAAEEVGLSRQAVERALAERLDLPTTPPVAGSLRISVTLLGAGAAAGALVGSILTALLMR